MFSQLVSLLYRVMERYENLIREKSLERNDSPGDRGQGSEDQHTAEILHDGFRIPLSDFMARGTAAAGASLHSDPKTHGNQPAAPADTGAGGRSSDTVDPPPNSHATPQVMNQVRVIDNFFTETYW